MQYSKHWKKIEGIRHGDRNPPTHTAEVSYGIGKRTRYDRIGVAWQDSDGAFFVRLYGTQFVSEPFFLFPIDRPEEGA